MLNVIDDKLVVEEKGIYSVEKFLISRRFMYWQVYLHKTSLVAEQVLIRIFNRAKELIASGVQIQCSEALYYFLQSKISKSNFEKNTLKLFSELDDYDVMSAIKSWKYHDDFVLQHLCSMIINRNLLGVKLKRNPPKSNFIDNHKKKLVSKYEISKHEASYFVFTGKVFNIAYNKNEGINVLLKSGKAKDLLKVSDHLDLNALTIPVVKHFICFPKNHM